MNLPTYRHGIPSIESHFGGLPARPKQQIAEYVAGLGIAIPEIFPDVDAALNSGLPFVARSEHPAELLYSDLAESYKHSPQNPGRRDISVESLRALDSTLTDPDRDFNSVTAETVRGRRGYITAERWRSEATEGVYTTEDKDEFARQHGLSYWAHAEGDNIFMVEDSGKPGRYYAGKINGNKELVVIEDGEIRERMGRSYQQPEQITAPEKLVDFYQQIRRLPLLDSTNVPIVELVDPGLDENPLFLQVLPTQSQTEADFEVGRPSNNVYFLRGTTPEEGIELTYWTRTFDYRDEPLANPCGTARFEGEALREYYIPEVDLYTPPVDQDDTPREASRRLLLATVDHGARSHAFKPRVTVGLTYEAITRLNDRNNGRGGKTECFIRSDGMNASVQYYDTRDRKVVTL